MAKKILLKRSLVANTLPTVSELDLGELALNAYEGRLYVKRSYLDEIGNPAEKIVQIGGRVPVENTLYVSEGGDDTREGTSWEESFASIERAVEVATTRGELCLIDVGPGFYFTQGHIDVPDNCVIKCVHRTAIIRPVPGYEERNVFRLGSGCFVEGFLIEGFRVNDMDNPTEGFAISFRPGAVITRAPYAHKVAVRSIPTWDYIAPPLDRNNANPLVGVGGGVVLADGSVCSPYSIYPNIMTWGATPVVHNGIGYCAKKGGLINAVNAVSLWAHKHFYAIDGGQIILSSCSTQFGDYTMVSKGARNLVYPTEIADVSILDPVNPSETVVIYPALSSVSPFVSTTLAAEIETLSTNIVELMWEDLVLGGYVTGWSSDLEDLTRRDAATFLSSIVRTLETGSESYMLNFARGLFFADGSLVFTSDKKDAFLTSFDLMGAQIKGLESSTATEDALIDALIVALKSTLDSPTTYATTLSVQTAAANAIQSNKFSLISNMWNALASEGLTAGWTLQQEILTRRDAGTLLDAITNCLNTANELYITNFLKSLYDSGVGFFPSEQIPAFVFSYNNLRDQITALSTVDNTADILINGIVNSLNFTVRYPEFIAGPALTVQNAAASAITSAKTTIINNTWNALVAGGYTVGWNAEDETYTKRDTGTLIQSILWVLQSANEKPMMDFAKGLFDTVGNKIYSADKESAFIYSFNYIKEQISLLSGVGNTADLIVDGLITSLINTITNPTLRVEPSTITAIGHTWTGVLAGVALTKIPPVRNQANIRDSILELDTGVVIASGQDDQGSAIFVGGMEINADTGELGGPPFEQAVNRIATKIAISRSF